MSQPIDKPAPESVLEAHIRQIQANEQASFHMPGHKGPQGAPPRGRRLLGDLVYEADLSELSGFDYLHGPGSALIEAQERAATLFGADQTWFLINGATVGNIAAICATVRDGETILVARDSHRSVYAGIAVSGAIPIYLAPARNEPIDGLYGIELDEVRAALVEHPEIRAIHVTSPSYYGFTTSVREVADLAHLHGIPLIVDEAHGAHFVFSDRFPLSALDCGADLVVQSPHKTLGSLTQSSLLHTQGGRVDLARVQSELGMLQSSSPSALLLVSLDVAVAEMQQNGAMHWNRALDYAKEIRSSLGDIQGIKVYGDEILNTPGIASYDPTKIVVDVDELGTTGFAAGRWLRSTWKINPEFCDLRRMVFSITIGDTASSKDLLISALRALAKSPIAAQEHTTVISRWPTTVPIAAISLRSARSSRSSAVRTPEAIGRVGSANAPCLSWSRMLVMPPSAKFPA